MLGIERQAITSQLVKPAGVWAIHLGTASSGNERNELWRPQSGRTTTAPRESETAAVRWPAGREAAMVGLEVAAGG